MKGMHMLMSHNLEECRKVPNGRFRSSDVGLSRYFAQRMRLYGLLDRVVADHRYNIWQATDAFWKIGATYGISR